ncbi:MAG: DNA replication and repair protein RecF [Legionellaceae bacterium]|nr:DNA replication and repair protein RecF [Legionellaceae bacterium]
MSIQELRIHHLRAFEQKTFQFSPHLNFVIAPNGLGKTSLLEAIYLLSCGHSFRTREIAPLIAHGQECLTLYSTLYSDDTLSMQKSLQQHTRIKINQQHCRSTSELARYLPCQIYYQDIFTLMDGAPALRRMMLDWGVFHVEPSYHEVLKQYRLLLKQRNALLRQQKPRHNFEPWDQQLSRLAEQIHALRLAYMHRLQDQLQGILAELSVLQCQVVYEKGWDKKEQGESLYDQLARNFAKDSLRGYTAVGIHQADVHFLCDDVPAKKRFSRGQQKMVLIALKLAQTCLLPKECIHLLDDIFAELDSGHIQALLHWIAQNKGQYITTLLPASEVHLHTVPAAHLIRLE